MGDDPCLARHKATYRFRQNQPFFRNLQARRQAEQRLCLELWGSHSWLPPAFSRAPAELEVSPVTRKAGWKAGCRQDCPPYTGSC